MSDTKSLWKKLTSNARLREEKEPKEEDKSNAFLSDYYRVVFSSAFRRLQDKTQVNPLASTDFVRRRLTHSFEVAVIGERIARVLATRLKSRIGDNDYRDKFGKIVATACLLHDIGNPPFGHEGELAIRNWAEKHNVDNPGYKCFDGNAQGFRIATRLQHHGKEMGMNLTAATLSAMLKYPEVITDNFSDEIDERGKFCIMQSEEKLFRKICKKVDLKEGERHPLSFVVEAADDIVNRLVDIEDGIKLNYLDYIDVIDKIKSLKVSKYTSLVDEMEKRRKSIKVGTKKEKQMWAFQNFRVNATTLLAVECEDVFIDNIDEIELGKFEGDLISNGNHKSFYDAFLDLEVNQIFNKPGIVRVEKGGKKAIEGLLDIYLNEMKSDSKLFNTIPDYLEFEDENDENKNVRRIVDYVAGMTDRFAVKQYQELSGISL